MVAYDLERLYLCVGAKGSQCISGKIVVNVAIDTELFQRRNRSCYLHEMPRCFLLDIDIRVDDATFVTEESFEE